MEEITLQDIDTYIASYDTACASIVVYMAEVTNLTDEIDAIKQDAEAYARETSSTASGVPAVKKDYLAKHARYNVAVAELRQAQNSLMKHQADQESCRMKAWARIAILQCRKPTLGEQHTHPVDSGL